MQTTYSLPPQTAQQDNPPNGWHAHGPFQDNLTSPSSHSPPHSLLDTAWCPPSLTTPFRPLLTCSLFSLSKALCVQREVAVTKALQVEQEAPVLYGNQRRWPQHALSLAGEMSPCSCHPIFHPLVTSGTPSLTLVGTSWCTVSPPHSTKWWELITQDTEIYTRKPEPSASWSLLGHKSNSQSLS